MNTNAIDLPALRASTKRRLVAVWLAAAFILGPVLGTEVALAANPPPTGYSLMHLTEADRAAIQLAHLRAPQVQLIPSVQAAFAQSKSLLSSLPYLPAERDQGACGNCWAWAGTGVMEIAQTIQQNVHNRLSVQFINSCNSSRTCCEGGWLQDVAGFYAGRGFAIPWANSNAEWRSGGGSCANTACGSISTANANPITRISVQTIPTWGVGQGAAIANIKNVLNQNRGVWFGFFLPTATDWDRFFDFWDHQPETAVWSDFRCGQPSLDGGHAVLCVGYNDSDPANPYWIMVNSWGTAGGGRPNGIFRVSMNLDYDCRDGSYNALYWQTLDIQFAGPLAVTLADALDAPALSWSTGGSANWTGQRLISHDGVDAAAAGSIGDNQESWLQTSVTGPGTVRFQWKVSSEASYDFLRVQVDGTDMATISGEVNWQQRTLTLGTGPHQLRWRYTKDLSVTRGQDRGWVDQVSFTPGATPSIVHVDWRSTDPSPDGSPAHPFRTVAQGYTAITAGGTMRVSSGNYLAAFPLNKPMLVEPNGGNVRLGPTVGNGFVPSGDPGPAAPLPELGVPTRRTSGLPAFSFTGVAGRRYQIHTSTNLETWELWKDFIAESNAFEIVDPDAAITPNRFYKVQPY